MNCSARKLLLSVSLSVFRCVLASLNEVMSVCLSVGQSVGLSVCWSVTQTFKSHISRLFHQKISTNKFSHAFFHSFIHSFIHKKCSFMKNVHSKRTHCWPTWPCFSLLSPSGSPSLYKEWDGSLHNRQYLFTWMSVIIWRLPIWSISFVYINVSHSVDESNECSLNVKCPIDKDWMSLQLLQSKAWCSLSFFSLWRCVSSVLRCFLSFILSALFFSDSPFPV